MPLGHLGCGHAGVRSSTRQHQEQVGIERALHPTAHVLNVLKQIVQIQVDLERGLDAVACTIHE